MDTYTISAEDRDKLIRGVEQAQEDMRRITSELAVLMAKASRFEAVLDVCDLAEFEAARTGSSAPGWVAGVRRAAVEGRDIDALTDAAVKSMGTRVWRPIFDARKALNEQINQAARREADEETA
jgi:hypothetical protein